ncbi:hypothetical protein GJ496_005795 [Pomphorhynchus laevis]|nr:hypothetical protein GJ496_005795 [Pomphorhynchus laevis]
MAYHDALMALKAFKETGKSIKSYLYEFKCSNVQRSLAQVSKTLKHEKKVDDIIERSGLLEREKFLDPCLAKLLVYDACYGTEVKGRFRGIIKRNYTALMEAKKQVEREYPCEIKDENYECPRYALVNTLRSNMDEVKTYLTENLGFEEIQGCSCDNFDKMCEMLRPGETFFIDPHIRNLLVFHRNDSRLDIL